MDATSLTAADVAYVRANFRPLAELCEKRGADVGAVRTLVRERLLPAPSYVLPDGAEMVPPDYFAFVDEVGDPGRMREEFERRHRAAGGAPDELEADWQGYLDGVYGICLRSVSPETIVRKTQLVESVTALPEHEAIEDASWSTRLRDEIDQLDALEREFSPDYDRRRFERPPSRDLLIRRARDRFPDLFTKVKSSGR